MHQLDYAASYTLARAIKRHHHFYVGPTNSGKTYHALNSLMAAKSGVYLAPLRLLAMEVRDKLVAAGVPCNLITGEERVYVAGAQHTASTIEMMNANNPVEVAIIDEIQLLQDTERGSAWTNALVGVPAQQVFVCGANSVTSICLAVIECLKETHEITHLQRMTPLVLEDDTLCGKHYNLLKLKAQLQIGDAVIAFSRKDVLTFSAKFRQWGFSVASIYGALSPEVRRHESERFCNGNANILVATDAIGMGLNLPIKRVIFATIHKFDGVVQRLLNATEVRQIAGRAGRFGRYEIGYVNVMEDDERFHIEHMLATDDNANLQKLPIGPNFDQLQKIAVHCHTAKLAECLEYAANRWHKSDHTDLNLLKPNFFELSNLHLQHMQALLIDEQAPELSLKDKWIFACAPISIHVNIERDYFLLCLKNVCANKVTRLPVSPSWLSANSTNSARHLKAAEILSQNISLYAWLSIKFPQIFIDAPHILTLRSCVSQYITRALLVQSGYGQTAKDMDYLAKRR